MFLPIFMRLQRLHAEINAAHIQYEYIYTYIHPLVAVDTP